MKLKRMGVSVELLRNVLQTGNVVPSFKVIADGLPGDAELFCVDIGSKDLFWVTFKSKEFPEVKEGEEVPILNTSFETVMP